MKTITRGLIVSIFLVIFNVQHVTSQCSGCQVTITAPTNAIFNLTAGQTVCINGTGAFTGRLNNFSGNTLCIGTGVTYNPSAAPNYNGNWTIINNGIFQNTNNLNFNSGTSFTNNANGTISLGSINLNSGMSFVNYGNLSLASATINSGASVTLGGTTVISGNLTNNASLTIAGNVTAGSLTNNGSGTIRGGASANCNYIKSTGSFTNNGSFGGSGQALLVGNSGGTINSPATSTVPPAPTGQPSTLVLTASGSNINGSFNAVSSGGYLVLRAIAATAPTVTNPTNFSNFTVGQTIGAWTVVALNSGQNTTTFSDAVGATCTNIHYRVFSYTASGNCAIFNTNNPLVGTYIPTPTIVTTAAASVCPSSNATLGATASLGIVNWYATAIGGASLATGTTYNTPSLNSTTTYYVDATSNGCTTASRTTVLATVLGAPAITLGTIPATCSGSTSVNVSYTNPINGVDQYMIDWSAEANAVGISDTNWATLSGGNITLSGLIATAGSYVFNVYVRNSVTGCQTNVSGSSVVTCNTANENATLTLTAPNGGLFTAINFASYGTPEGSCGSFTLSGCHAAASLNVIQTAAIGRNSFTITASNSVFGDPCVGIYKRLYVEAVSGGSVLTIKSNPVITVAPSNTANSYCLNSTAYPLNVTATGTNTYQWYSNTSASNIGGTLLLGETAANYTPLTTSPGISFYYVLVSSGGCTTNSSVSGAITINTTGPTILTTTPNSRVGTGTVTLEATASAGTLNWYAASTGGTLLGTGTSFTTPSIAVTTTFYVDATSGGCASSRTAVIATVNNAPTITISSVPTICSGTTSVTIPYTNPTDSPNQYMVDWSVAANTAGLADVPWTTLSGGSITLSGLIATAGNYNAAIYVRNTTTGAQGTAIGSAGTIVSCGIIDERSTLTMTSPTGGVFTAINFASYGTPTGSCGSFAISSCHASNSMSIVQAAALGRTTFSIAASNTVFGDPCVGTVKRLYVEAVSVGFNLTINALPAITTAPIATNQNYCQNAAPTPISVTATGAGLTYQWYSNTTNSNSGGTLISGANASTYSPSTATVGTMYYYAIVTNSATCSIKSSVSGAITVNTPTVAGTLSTSTTTICANSRPNAITVSGYTGSIIKWQYANNAAFTSGVTDIVSTAATLTSAVLGTLSSTRYYRAAIQSGSCSMLYTAPITITVPSAITYSNGSWNGTPSPTTPVIIASNFTLTSNLNVCSCQISNTVALVVPSNKTLIVQEGITIATTGSLTIEDQGSLVQINDAAVNSGVITYRRNTVPVKRYDYTYWSSPVNNQNLLAFSPDTLLDKFYQFNPTIGNWEGLTPSTTTMQAGRGYIIRAPQTNSITSPSIFSGSFVGTPNNGVINYTVENAASNLNLIGNPYPSAIDIDAFLNDASNAAVVNGTIYLWTHNTLPSNQIPGNWTYNYTSDDYAIYNSTGAVSTGSALSSGINTTTPNGKIAAGQSFLIKAITTGTVKFNNSMRLIDNNNRFFRTIDPVIQNPTKSRIWLNLTNSEGVFKQLLVGYIPGATNEWDSRFDGETLNGNSFVDFYSLGASDKMLSIHARALPFDQQDLVPLGFKATVAGTYTIGLDHFDGLFENQAVYLEDKLLQIVHDLKTGSYDFATEVGSFNNRFQLRYTNQSLANPSFDFTADSIIIYKQNEQLVINAGKNVLSKVEVFDTRGRLIAAKSNINNAEVRIAAGVSNEVLLVRLYSKNGGMVTKKVLY